MTIFKDGANERSFETEEHSLVSAGSDEMTVECLPRGGFVMVIKK